MGTKLNMMDQFPDVTLTSTAGDEIRLPEDISSSYAIVLFYRGHW